MHEDYEELFASIDGKPAHQLPALSIPASHALRILLQTLLLGVLRLCNVPQARSS